MAVARRAKRGTQWVPESLCADKADRYSIRPCMWVVLAAQLVLAAVGVAAWIHRSDQGPVRRLPDGPVLMGYFPYSGRCNQHVLRAAEHGVNVVNWFSIDLLADPKTGLPTVRRGPANLTCVAEVAAQLRAGELGHTAHLISIGGWNEPHMDTAFSAEEWWAVLKRWLDRPVPALQWRGFDGFDWDLEGHDDPAHPNNRFSLQQLQLMGRLSQLAKTDNYLVTMAPAQSYLDVHITHFSRSLAHSPPWKPNFPYHGANTYGYVLSQYGRTKLRSGRSVPTFDLVSLQLYEGWSRANHALKEEQQPARAYLPGLVQAVLSGWEVDCRGDQELSLSSFALQIQPSQLLLGLANGWASRERGTKFLYLPAQELGEAWQAMQQQGIAPRGAMFWDMTNEGKHGIYYARDLNTFLKTRPSRQ